MRNMEEADLMTQGLAQHYLKEFNDQLAVANKSLKGNEFHRKVLAELRSDFHENIIPELYHLTRRYNKIDYGS